MLGRTDSRRRLLALLLLFAVASLALVARLASWQVAQRDWLVDQASSQTSITVKEPTRRGEIYDRTGTVLLATSVPRDRLVAAPKSLDRAERRQPMIDSIALRVSCQIGSSTQCCLPASVSKPAMSRPISLR